MTSGTWEWEKRITEVTEVAEEFSIVLLIVVVAANKKLSYSSNWDVQSSLDKRRFIIMRTYSHLISHKFSCTSLSFFFLFSNISGEIWSLTSTFTHYLLHHSITNKKDFRLKSNAKYYLDVNCNEHDSDWRIPKVVR